MSKTLLHVYQQRIRHNITKPAAERDPPIIIRRGRKREYANTAALVVDGRVVAHLVYSPDKPLSCGARVWLSLEEGTEVRGTV